jgi:tetratricopeptide (TPR) repeat protein
MTDLSRATVDEWRRHPRLQPWVDEGLLQLACYDVEHDDGAGTLTAAGLRNPLAVIANYVFDSLPHDAFTVRDGRLYEELVTLEVGGAGPDPDLDDPAVLAEVSVRYEQSPTTADHYDDPAWNAVLRRYQESLDATTFLFPVGALRSLERLSDLAGGRLMVISADKGYHRLADLDGRGQPHLAVHGSVSMMVNHDAIGQWVEGRGGRFLTLDRRAGALDVCVALLGDAHGDATETRQAYTGAVDEVGPDDLFTLKKAVERAPDGGDWSIAELVAHLRLSGWDARIFLGCFGALLDRVDGASDAEKEELADVARKVWDGYFWIGERQDVPFELGLLCYGIGRLEDAVAFWGHSLDLHGPDPATFLNLATCHREQGEPDKAWLYVNRALDLDPESEPAQALRHALASKEFAS